jgi:two-component system phosphate regulon sensor histidine kinase PhoR
VVTTLFDDQNELLGTLAVLTDIRDEKTAKTKHAEFVSSVAHEFKTPMASIKAFLELLIDEDVTEPAEQKDLFEKIDFQVSRLNRMVGNLLNLARIEAGAVKVTRTDCDLNDVLQKSADVVKPLAEERGQQLVLDLSQLYLPVQADRDLLGQAIINLLSNAVKYTPEQGRITLRSQMLELEALVTVEDTGLGIPPDSLPKIFDRFYRVPEHQHSATGTGLGLAFVQTVVEDLHNGHISVESTVGKGSKFLVRIPLGHQQTHKRARKPEAVPEESAASV